MTKNKSVDFIKTVWYNNRKRLFNYLKPRVDIMRKINFIKEPGFAFDLFFLFVLHFNKDYCLTNFINYNKSAEDTDYFNRLLKDFPPISDELRPFFQITEHGKCFITEYCFEPYKEELLNGFNLSDVLMAFSDYEQVSENLLKFYFRNTDGEYLSECKHSLSAVNNLIKSSDYSGELKSTLYYFFIEPEEIILSLARELTEKAAALSQKYDESLDLLNKLKDEFDFETLFNGLENLKIHKMDTAGFEEIYISFCLLNKNVIKSYYYDNAVLLLLGLDYADFLNSLAAQSRMPVLEDFGNAISEPNRTAILNLILQKGEITIKDLEQEFGFTGTNAYYHLSLMIKAGMLKTRNRGRTVLYSINKGYFRALCELLGKYYKEQ